MDTQDSAAKRILERALENVGDGEKLAQLLDVHIADLSRWLLGRQLPPHEVFLRALDLAFGRTAPVASPHIASRPPSRRKGRHALSQRRQC